MDDMNDVTPESLPEEVVVEETPAPEVPAAPAAKPEEKVVPYDRFKKVNDELTALKKRPVVEGSLQVNDYIDISAALDGLDPREKHRLAEEHTNTGRSLKEIRESEDFQLWQSAYRAKMEKENALKPSATQANADAPVPLAVRLQNATLAEKEEILRELNLYKENRPRADRVNIGNIRR